MLFPGRRTRFENCKFVTEPNVTDNRDAMVYEIPPERTGAGYVGIIASIQCVFRGCTFVDVGVMGPSEQIRKVKEVMDGEGSITVDYS